MTVLSHSRGTVHSIFKICISRNMKCDKMVGFLKYSHICTIVHENIYMHIMYIYTCIHPLYVCMFMYIANYYVRMYYGPIMRNDIMFTMLHKLLRYMRIYVCMHISYIRIYVYSPIIRMYVCLCTMLIIMYVFWTNHEKRYYVYYVT